MCSSLQQLEEIQRGKLRGYADITQERWKDIIGRMESGRLMFSYYRPEKKAELMSKSRPLRGTNIYLNDHLSMHNSELFSQARKFKRENTMVSAWTQHCCVYIKINEGGQRLYVKTLADLARI